MPRPIVLATLAGTSLLAGEPAFANDFAGLQVFDDSNVADEASLPTFSSQPKPSDGGLVSNLFAAEFEFDKRITDNFGFALDGGYQWLIQ